MNKAIIMLQASTEPAMAGAYRNNCGFHCVAHSLFSLSAKALKTLFSKEPMYQELINRFYEYYELPLQGDFLQRAEEFLDLIASFSHPSDREILMGPFLRKFLIDQKLDTLSEEDAHDLLNSSEVSSEMIGLLTTVLGAELTIHTTQGNIQSKPAGKPLWQIQMFHVANGGGHYDFSYQDISLNAFHNSQYKMDESNRRVPIAETLLHDASNSEGVEAQVDSIKEIVQINYSLLQKPTDKKKPDLTSAFSLKRSREDVKDTTPAPEEPKLKKAKPARKPKGKRKGRK